MEAIAPKVTGHFFNYLRFDAIREKKQIRPLRSMACLSMEEKERTFIYRF